MFEVVPFKAAHLGAIRLQAAQMYLSEWVSNEQGEALEQAPSYTALEDGVPICAAGVIPIWTGRAMAWSFISDVGPTNFLKCHRAVKRFLDGCFVQRIEMTVDCNHPEAHRWARLLGFTMEAKRMKAYAPDGHDCALYSRVL
jgi:hypothetical protein|tara:strand:- start:26 stop:451 length:426 start_codon:yes stop_codon:yes gene_type:complete